MKQTVKLMNLVTRNLLIAPKILLLPQLHLLFHLLNARLAMYVIVPEHVDETHISDRTN